jgi:triacylglycerol lipase
MVGIELVYLRISPVYWGFGIPRGDGSAVVVVPGFMMTDSYLTQFREWLDRIGYRSFLSGIGVNSECPNLLIKRHLIETIEQAYRATHKKVHLVGHSLGGMIARAIGCQMRDRVASVIMLGAPFQGVSVHSSVLRMIESARQQILERNGTDVLPDCYTAACTCSFLASLTQKFPKGVRQTAIYAKTDGLVDWRACITGDPGIDVEVSATHLGMVFSPIVYDVVARRLAGK